MATKNHSIPIGTLVELPTGARLFVAYHGWDCDKTPLYWLSPEAGDTEQQDSRFKNPSWLDGGYSESEFAVVRAALQPKGDGE